jgi:uncharacterized membrane protein YebE (DUF533 family)
MVIGYEASSKLRAEEKDAILDAMLGMAWSDGSVHIDELDLLRKIAAHFTDKNIEDLARDYKPDLARVSRKIAASDLGPTGKQVLLRVMSFVAAAEGSVDEKEMAFYEGCIRAFGVQPAVRERMESQVRLEVYAEHLKKLFLRDAADDAARAKLALMRMRFNIDDAAAEQVEKVVRREVEATKPAAPAAPPATPP